MGSGNWDRAVYSTRAASISTKSTNEIFTSNSIKPYLNPNGVLLRESRDSEDNPLSTPFIFGIDVTGSMGIIADKLARAGLGRLVEGILDRKPVTDPHIMVMAIGDVNTDRAPLQVSQFEADIRIAEQLSDLWLEGNGGGNGFESYDLPWYFAGQLTSIDSFEKRGKKGYLFTIGDELPARGLSSANIKRVFGNNDERAYTEAELLSMASEKYHVFHIIVEQGGYARRDLSNVTGSWRELLGKRAVLLSDYDYMPEVILAVTEVSEGANPEEIVASFEDKHIQQVVRHALFD